MKNNTNSLRIVGLVILMISGFTLLQAQDSSDASYNSEGRFGIRGGVTISKQNFEGGNLTEDPKSKFGADLAILATLPIGDGFFAIQPELHWMQKGSTIEDINGDDVNNTFNYLELPVLLRFNFGGSAKIFLIGGPSVGYLLGGKSGDEDIDKDFYNELEFGAHIGAGIGLGPIEVDVRYIAGFSDISEVDNLEVKNSGFGAGVTLKF